MRNCGIGPRFELQELALKSGVWFILMWVLCGVAFGVCVVLHKYWQVCNWVQTQHAIVAHVRKMDGLGYTGCPEGEMGSGGYASCM